MLVLAEMWPQGEDEAGSQPQPRSQPSLPSQDQPESGRETASDRPEDRPAGRTRDYVESEQAAAVRRTRIGDAPEQFIWRGRLYLVRAVLEHEPGRVERWQVAAAAGAFMPTGVFSLEFDWKAGTWAVYRLPDEVWEQTLGRHAPGPSEGTRGSGEEDSGEAER